MSSREHSEFHDPISGSTVDLGGLFQIWLRARRRNTKAQQKLHRLLVQNPGIEVHLRKFSADHVEAQQARAKSQGISQKKVAPISQWGKMLSKAPPYVVIVGGGLPTLGKKR